MFDVCVIFFFSSRRRHTRCGRDWSSDGVLFRSLNTFEVFLGFLIMGKRVKLKASIQIYQTFWVCESNSVKIECFLIEQLILDYSVIPPSTLIVAPLI